MEPARIRPELVPVDSSDDTGLLFRLATTLWSVPVSKGYGRRIRYLVVDRSNDKLIGLFAIGDPVAGMAARDHWIGWSTDQRRRRLKNVLDAYVCGAVPPYNLLLGGKLVVSLMGSREVVNEFHSRYFGQPNASGVTRYPRLALITVTSALGRSSLYNRVRLPGLVDLQRVLAPTLGWGHFQVPDEVFTVMRDLLRLDGHHYADGYHYGQGPNWRMRVIREALKRCDLDEGLLRHGISREVFAMPLADNWREYLTEQTDDCVIDRPTVDAIAHAAIDRWVIPRAGRRPEWADWTAEDRAQLFNDLVAG